MWRRAIAEEFGVARNLAYRLAHEEESYDPLVAGRADRAPGAAGRAGAGLSRRPPPARLTIARLQYDGGGDWYANPSSLRTCSRRSASAPRSRWNAREARVTLLDDRIWDYPFLHVTGHGNIHFSDAEVVRLREYLARGGFLHVDDNYGLDASFRREIARRLPRPAARGRAAHRIRSITWCTTFRAASPRSTSTTGKPARGFGIFLGDRLVVYYSFSSDLGNGWEDVQHVQRSARAA